VDIGERIRALREARGVSRDALARACGMAAGSIYLIESGRRPHPSSESLEKIARGLRVYVSALYEGEPVPLGEAPREAVPLDMQPQGEWLKERLLSGAIAVETVDQDGSRFHLSVEDVGNYGIAPQLYEALSNVELGEGEKIVVTVEPVTDPAARRGARAAGRAAGRIASAVRQQPLFGESGEAAHP